MNMTTVRDKLVEMKLNQSKSIYILQKKWMK